VSLKKSLAWMGLAQAITFILHFGSSVVLARYLTPTEMGVFAVGLATIAMLALLQTFGLQPLIVREKTLTPALTNTVFTVNAASGVLQAATTFLFAFVGAKFLRNEGVKDILMVLSVVPLFTIFSFMPGSMLEREGRFKIVAIIGTLVSVVGSAATITFAIMGYKYMSLAYANILGAMTLSGALMIAGRKDLRVKFGLSEWRHVFRFGAQMFAYTGVVNFSTRFNEIMLGRIAGLEALGLYNRASGINNMLWGNIHYLASRVMLAEFAAKHRSDTPLRDRYIQTASVLTAVLWPGFAGLAVLAEPFIYLVYGPRWVPAALPLIYLTIASIVLVAMTMSWELFAVTGNVAKQTRLEIVRTCISTPLFIGACFVSIEAAAITRIIDAVIAYVIYRPHLERMSGTKFQDFIGVYSQGALLTFVAILPAGTLAWLSQGDKPEFLMVALAVTSGIALWAVTLFQLDHPLKHGMVAVLKKLSLRFARTRSSEEARIDLD